MFSIRREKGKEAEHAFKEWLDFHKIPYMYISQDIDNFSPAFKKLFSGKRPDFIVMIPNFGLIFVDVKSRILNEDYKTFPIENEDFEKYSSIHSQFNTPIWIVVSNKTQLDYKKWFWISTAKLQNLKLEVKQSKLSGDFFLPVYKSYFIEIKYEENISKLFEGI